MKIIKKHYKKILICIVAAYAISVFVSQQKTLNSYNAEIKNYDAQIAEAKETNESLTKMKENVNSPEYIENMAREKIIIYTDLLLNIF